MRAYDVVLFGATGFTGRQAVAYFSRHAPKDVRWAIAGRNREKLNALEAGVGIVLADTADQASIDAMAAQTRVIVSTAGPFALYGTPVVDACVRHQTDYVDITGETFWVESLVGRYHARAEASGTRIVPCCGFDSVPSDLGAWLLARRHSAAVVRAYFQIGGGGLNGGTVASVSNLVAERRAGDVARRDVMPLPHFDDWIGTWVGPFFMAPTNTWVVARSAALLAAWGEPYPAGFTYREFLKYDAPFAAVKSIATSAAIGGFGAAMAIPPLFRGLQRLLPKPGEGPSEAAMARGWFSCELIGQTANGERVDARIYSRGDAGNRSTVKMLCESALCLHYSEGGTRGGVLTPATAFGDHLVNRLRAADVAISGG